MLSILLKNGRICTEKYNFYIKYFDKIKCYADRPYLVFSELKPETHIYIFWPYANDDPDSSGLTLIFFMAMLFYFLSNLYETC